MNVPGVVVLVIVVGNPWSKASDEASVSCFEHFESWHLRTPDKMFYTYFLYQRSSNSFKFKHH